MMNEKINRAHSIAMGVALIGVIAYVVGLEYGWMMLAAGAFAVFLIRLYVRAKTTDHQQMRLITIMMFGAVLLMGASYLMYTNKNYWVLPLTIDAVIELYVSFRLKK